MTVQMVSEVAARSDVPQSTDAPEPYNFDRPISLARDQARVLMAGLEAFARQWNIELSTRLLTASQVTAVDVALLPYDAYANTLPEHSALMICLISGSSARAIVQVEQTAALQWVARMLGGAGARQIEPRTFSPVEQAILARTMNDAFELLKYSFGERFPSSMRVESFNYAPQTAQAANPADTMIIATLDVGVESSLSRITMAFPSSALAAQLDGAHAPVDGDPIAGLIRAQLDSVPVRVALQFQPTTVRPEVVLSLAEGDVIRIAHSKNRPLDFAVEGQVMARAAVGASGAQLACVIVDTQESTGTGTP